MGQYVHELKPQSFEYDYTLTFRNRPCPYKLGDTIVATVQDDNGFVLWHGFGYFGVVQCIEESQTAPNAKETTVYVETMSQKI